MELFLYSLSGVEWWRENLTFPKHLKFETIFVLLSLSLYLQGCCEINDATVILPVLKKREALRNEMFFQISHCPK